MRWNIQGSNEKVAKIASSDLPTPFEKYCCHQNCGRQTLVQLNECMTLPISEKDLREICGRIDDYEPSGMDGTPNAALKLTLKTRIDFFANTFKTWLQQRRFPPQRKKRKFVLLPNLIRSLTMQNLIARSACWIQEKDGRKSFLQ